MRASEGKITCFRFYGLALWLPDLFDRFEAHYKGSNISVTVCELTRLNADLNVTNFDNQTNCLSEIDVTIYFNTFITGTACLIGNVLCSLVADVIGLKFLSGFVQFPEYLMSDFMVIFSRYDVHFWAMCHSYLFRQHSLGKFNYILFLYLVRQCCKYCNNCCGLRSVSYKNKVNSSKTRRK